MAITSQPIGYAWARPTRMNPTTENATASDTSGVLEQVAQVVVVTDDGQQHRDQRPAAPRRRRRPEPPGQPARLTTRWRVT